MHSVSCIFDLHAKRDQKDCSQGCDHCSELTVTYLSHHGPDHPDALFSVQKAIDLAKKATAADLNCQYEEAVRCYQQAIDYFLYSLKCKNCVCIVDVLLSYNGMQMEPLVLPSRKAQGQSVPNT